MIGAAKTEVLQEEMLTLKISTKPTRTVKVASLLTAMRSKMLSMTQGITPLALPVAVRAELPMVYVLPEPVWP